MRSFTFALLMVAAALFAPRTVAAPTL